MWGGDFTHPDPKQSCFTPLNGSIWLLNGGILLHGDILCNFLLMFELQNGSLYRSARTSTDLYVVDLLSWGGFLMPNMFWNSS